MNKRFGSFFILVLVFTFICSPHPGVVYGQLLEFRILDAPLFAQQTRFWCWAAGGEMIMDFFGKKVPQCEQANNRAKPKRSDCCLRPIPDGCLLTSWPDFLNNRFTFKSTPYKIPLKWKILKNQIDKNKPVGFSWLWLFESNTIGHYMVARGYVILAGYRLVLVNDPAPADKDKYKGGSFKIYSYDYYVSSPHRHSHWHDQYNITKK